MTNRAQVVSCNGETSNALWINLGGPQGGLGTPLYFNLSVTDLPVFIETYVFGFADDHTAVIGGKIIDGVYSDSSKEVVLGILSFFQRIGPSDEREEVERANRSP